MPFVALDPPAKSIAGTGVKLTVSPARGMTVTLNGAALAAVGGMGDDDQRWDILVNLEIGVRQLRLVPRPEGKFAWYPTKKGEARTITVGRQPFLADACFAGLTCTWETIDAETPGLDIDLPREIAIPTDSVTVVRGQPSTSHSTPRTASVTLPATGNGRTRSA